MATRTLALKASRPRKIRVGDRVVYQLAATNVFADVVEDRGFIGVGGRQLLRIRTGAGTESEREFEMPAAELELVHQHPARRRPPQKKMRR